MLWSKFTRVRYRQKWSTVAMSQSGAIQWQFFQPWYSLKVSLLSWGWWIIFHYAISFPTEKKTNLASFFYYIAISIENGLMSCIPGYHQFRPSELRSIILCELRIWRKEKRLSLDLKIVLIMRSGVSEYVLSGRIYLGVTNSLPM